MSSVSVANNKAEGNKNGLMPRESILSRSDEALVGKAIKQNNSKNWKHTITKTDDRPNVQWEVVDKVSNRSSTPRGCTDRPCPCVAFDIWKPLGQGQESTVDLWLMSGRKTKLLSIWCLLCILQESKTISLRLLGTRMPSLCFYMFSEWTCHSMPYPFSLGVLWTHCIHAS